MVDLKHVRKEESEHLSVFRKAKILNCSNKLEIWLTDLMPIFQCEISCTYNDVVRELEIRPVYGHHSGCEGFRSRIFRMDLNEVVHSRQRMF